MRAPGAAAGARCWHERALSAPTRVVDTLHGISAPTRVVDTSARYIPLTMSTTPSRCQRPPHGADNARPHPGEHPRQGRARCGRDQRGHGRPHPLPRGTPAPGPDPRRTAPDRAPPPRNTHTRTPIHETRTAHKGGIKPLCAAQCCVIPSLVCDTSGHGHRKRTERRSRPTNQRRTRTSKPANPRRKGRLTAWGPPAPPGEPRPQRRPTAVASPRGAGRRCHP